MKTKTKQLIGAAAVSGLILAAGGAVFAHGGFGPGWTGPGMHGGGHGMHGGGYGMRGSGYGMHGGGYGMRGGGYGMHGGGYGMRGGGYGMHGGGYGMRGGMMGGPGGMQDFMGGPRSQGGDPIAYTNEWLTNLKQTLGITAEQETVWNGYVEASQAKAKLMDAHHQTMHGGARGTVDTEEHLNMMQEGAQHMQQLATATRELYTALTKEQKATADRWVGPRHFSGLR